MTNIIHTSLISLCLVASTTLAETNLVHQWLGDTNLVAVVAGYQTTRKLEVGIEVPVLSIDGTKNGDETGVLFYVVAPTNSAGRYFWMHHDGLMASGYVTSLYKTNTLYYFPFNQFQRDLYDNGVLHPETIYDLNSIGKGSPCTLKPLGWRYFTSSDEVKAFLSELRKEQDIAEREVISARDRLNRADKPPPAPQKGEPRGLSTSEKRRKYSEYYKVLSELQHQESQIRCRESQMADAQQQFEKLKAEVQQGAPSNPHSP